MSDNNRIMFILFFKCVFQSIFLSFCCAKYPWYSMFWKTLFFNMLKIPVVFLWGIRTVSGPRMTLRRVLSCADGASSADSCLRLQVGNKRKRLEVLLSCCDFNTFSKGNALVVKIRLKKSPKCFFYIRTEKSAGFKRSSTSRWCSVTAGRAALLIKAPCCAAQFK